MYRLIVMVMVMVMVFIYRIFYMYIFKCGLHLTTQPMNHEIAQRPDQHTGNSTPYSLRKVCGFFNVTQSYEH